MNLTGIAGDTYATVSWEIPENDGGSEIMKYNIYRSNESEGTFDLIGNTTELMYNDTNLVNGVSMYYKITAVNINGESGFSSEISVIPIAPVISTPSISSESSTSNPPTSLSTKEEGSSGQDNQFTFIGSFVAILATFGSGIIFKKVLNFLIPLTAFSFVVNFLRI